MVSGLYYVTGGLGPYILASDPVADGLSVTENPEFQDGTGPAFLITGLPATLGYHPGVTLTVTDLFGATQALTTAAFTVIQ